VPVIQIDYHFLKDDGEELEINDTTGKTERFKELYATTLAVVDCDTAAPLQITLPAKGGNTEYAVACIEAFARRLGHQNVRLRSDGEPSIKQLAAAVAAKRLKTGLQTICEETPRYSSQSLGAVGGAAEDRAGADPHSAESA